jgi:hypothetical protein
VSHDGSSVSQKIVTGWKSGIIIATTLISDTSSFVGHPQQRGSTNSTIQWELGLVSGKTVSGALWVRQVTHQTTRGLTSRLHKYVYLFSKIGFINPLLVCMTLNTLNQLCPLSTSAYLETKFSYKKCNNLFSMTRLTTSTLN